MPPVLLVDLVRVRVRVRVWVWVRVRVRVRAKAEARANRVCAALLGDEGSEIFGRLQKLDAIGRAVSPLGELPLVLLHRDHLRLAVGRLRQLGDQLAHALRDLLPRD